MSDKDDKGKGSSQWDKAHGRRDGQSGQSDRSGRERNVGHSKDSEHSRIPKGNRG